MKAKLKSGSSSMGTSFECLFPYICRHHHALQFCVSRLITLHLFMSLIQGGFLFSIASLKLGCYWGRRCCVARPSEAGVGQSPALTWDWGYLLCSLGLTQPLSLLGFSFFIYKMKDKRTSKAFSNSLTLYPVPCSGPHSSFWHPRVNSCLVLMLNY